MFYTYSQNNSGGCFDDNEAVAGFVIIEAEDFALANLKAENIGIYFDGVANWVDCDCCGDRWNRIEEGDGSLAPKINNKSAFLFEDGYFNRNCIIYYSGGTKKKHSLSPCE